MAKPLGPVSMSDQTSKLIAILCRERDSAFEEIEMRGESHSRWLEQVTQIGKSKIIGVTCPPRKKAKFSSEGSEKENTATPPNVSPEDMASTKTESPTDSKASEESHPTLGITEIQKMKVKDLRDSLKARGLPTAGLKKELQDRLLIAIQKENVESMSDAKDEVMQEVVDITVEGEIVEPAAQEAKPLPAIEIHSTAMEVEKSVENDDAVKAASEDLILSDDLAEMRKSTCDIEMEDVRHSSSELLTKIAPFMTGLNEAEFQSNPPHFSEEVAVPATVPLSISSPSPKKKHNAIGKMMKATTKLFSPKRMKEKSPKKDGMPPPLKQAATVDSEQSSGPIGPKSTYAVIPSVASNSTTTATENVAQSGIQTYQSMAENVYSIPNFEKTLTTEQLSAYTRKFSTSSTTSTSSSSSAAAQSRIQEIRKRVREDQAMKAQEVSATASSNQPSAVKPAGEQARLAEMREKMREQAKANMSAAPGKIATVKGVASVAPVPPSASKADKMDDKKKLLAAQMREKAAAETNKKIDGVLSSKTAQTPVVSVLQQHSVVPTQQIQGEEKRSPMDTYEMSDRGSSSSSEDEESEEEKAGPKKAVPEWAQREKLQKALERQFGVEGQPLIDPDEVFGEVYTCDLSAIFGESKRYNKARKETGDWRNDKVTPMEKMVYKRDMGFD